MRRPPDEGDPVGEPPLARARAVPGGLVGGAAGADRELIREVVPGHRHGAGVEGRRRARGGRQFERAGSCCRVPSARVGVDPGRLPATVAVVIGRHGRRAGRGAGERLVVADPPPRRRAVRGHLHPCRVGPAVAVEVTVHERARAAVTVGVAVALVGDDDAVDQRVHLRRPGGRNGSDRAQLHDVPVGSHELGAQRLFAAVEEDPLVRRAIAVVVAGRGDPPPIVGRVGEPVGTRARPGLRHGGPELPCAVGRPEGRLVDAVAVVVAGNRHAEAGGVDQGSVPSGHEHLAGPGIPHGRVIVAVAVVVADDRKVRRQLDVGLEGVAQHDGLALREVPRGVGGAVPAGIGSAVAVPVARRGAGERVADGPGWLVAGGPRQLHRTGRRHPGTVGVVIPPGVPPAVAVPVSCHRGDLGGNRVMGEGLGLAEAPPLLAIDPGHVGLAIAVEVAGHRGPRAAGPFGPRSTACVECSEQCGRHLARDRCTWSEGAVGEPTCDAPLGQPGDLTAERVVGGHVGEGGGLAPGLGARGGQAQPVEQHRCALAGDHRRGVERPVEAALDDAVRRRPGDGAAQRVARGDIRERTAGAPGGVALGAAVAEGEGGEGLPRDRLGGVEVALGEPGRHPLGGHPADRLGER